MILATQMMFSGDGARCFTDLLPKGYCEVLYAEQMIMPNNVNNMKAFQRTPDAQILALAEEARAHIRRITEDLKAGRGFQT